MKPVRVLVTGATGFLGNHVVNELVKRGIPVVATGRDQDKLDNAGWPDSVERISFDLANSHEGVFDIFHNPSHCIHLAWSGLPNYNSETHMTECLPQSRSFLFDMINGGLQHLLVTGTCFEYGMQEGELDELTESKPSNPYGKAKDRLRQELESLVSGKPTRLQWARIFYMYGAGQGEKSLFAQLQKALDDGETTFDMSGGQQIRDFLPVEEVAEALVDIICHPTHSGVVNVCSGRSLVLQSLIQEYLQKRSASIKLNLGVYPYPDWEPFRFWGNAELLTSIRKEIRELSSL